MATNRSGEAFDIVTQRDIGATVAYQLKQRAKFGFHKKAYKLGALARLHKNISETSSSFRGNQVAELENTNKEALEAISKPSLMRYGIYTSGCILIDLVGVAMAAGDGTGVGLALTIALGIAITVFMWIYGKIILGGRLQKAKKKRQELRAQAGRLENDIKTVRDQYQQVRRALSSSSRKYPRLAARLTRTGSRIGGLASRSRLIVKGGRILTRVLRWKPLIWVGENIPVVRALPFWTIGAMATYIEHRAEFKTAQELLAQYNQGKNEVIAISDETFGVQLDTVEQDMITSSVEARELQEVAA